MCVEHTAYRTSFYDLRNFFLFKKRYKKLIVFASKKKEEDLTIYRSGHTLILYYKMSIIYAFIEKERRQV